MLAKNAQNIHKIYKILTKIRKMFNNSTQRSMLVCTVGCGEVVEEVAKVNSQDQKLLDQIDALNKANKCIRYNIFIIISL